MSTGDFVPKCPLEFPPRPSDKYDSAPSRKFTGHFGSFSLVSVNSNVSDRKSNVQALDLTIKSKLTKKFDFKKSIFSPFQDRIRSDAQIGRLGVRIFAYLNF